MAVNVPAAGDSPLRVGSRLDRVGNVDGDGGSSARVSWASDTRDVANVAAADTGDVAADGAEAEPPDEVALLHMVSSDSPSGVRTALGLAVLAALAAVAGAASARGSWRSGPGVG